MISVAEARARLLDLVDPLEVESVPLRSACGRVLAQPVHAPRDQPPFPSSSMDGYAIRSEEAQQHAMFQVIGESAAGHRFTGQVGAGQAVRIFTGAPVPDGANHVVIQEDVARRGDLITITDAPRTKDNIRRQGIDFKSGMTVTAPQLVTPSMAALLAAMNQASLPVTRRPVVALMSTGDELVTPGSEPGPDQIIASNTFGLAAMLEIHGAQIRILPIARDTTASLRTAFELAADVDLIVTIGGASVGDHDLVGPVAAELGLEQSFYKVRMRPGKPLMAGKLGKSAMVGLPGNPVSAMICGQVFIVPMIRRMLGLGPAEDDRQTASLQEAIAANGDREHYMRAVLSGDQIKVFPNQDSSLLSVLSKANALVVRPPGDPARPAGDTVTYLPL
ncbi:MAG: gephyrin-like molybdotransferase Glp [Pseudomonadota bacterium]